MLFKNDPERNTKSINLVKKKKSGQLLETEPPYLMHLKSYFNQNEEILGSVGVRSQEEF